MTLATTIAVTSPVTEQLAQLAFLKAREIIGIPAEHPFQEEHPALGADNGVWILSAMGDFDSALDVGHADGDVLTFHAEDIPDPIYLTISFDTGYSWRGESGRRCDDLHRHITTELGEWLDGLGLDWWGQDEFYGTWHQRTPCPILREKVSP